jgi:ParB-like nuclease domain
MMTSQRRSARSNHKSSRAASNLFAVVRCGGPPAYGNGQLKPARAARVRSGSLASSASARPAGTFGTTPWWLLPRATPTRTSVHRIAEGNIVLPGPESGERIAQNVSIDLLQPGNSPRLNGVDPQHIQLLAESGGALPPILVHRGTMRVIDGAHRLQAALLKGQKTVDVMFFDGNDDDAFVAAIEANNAHGLPLTLADRQAAAARVLASHPDRSDRWIAAVVGLAVGTVGAIRAHTEPNGRNVTARIGRDGRVRPVSGANGRKLASNVVAEQPDASLREIARVAGVSLGTARDVRERVRRGDDPVPASQAQSAARRLPAGRSHARLDTRNAATTRNARDSLALLGKLNADPSLRYSEAGRVLLRWLHSVARAPCKGTDLIDVLPSHCMYPVAQILRHCASQWLKTADQIDPRLQSYESHQRATVQTGQLHAPATPDHTTRETPEKAR